MKFQNTNMFRIMSICLTILFLGLMSASIIHAQTENYTFVTKWGSPGFGDGQFSMPNGIAVNSSGNVYVVDSGNNRIQKFTNNGKFINKWGSFGTVNGLFYNPVRIAIDSSGNVYVCDYSNRIQKFDSNGNFITKWGSPGFGDGQFSNPNGIAVDSSGYVYVIDSRVQKFDSNGNFISKWGSWGSGDGQFKVPMDVAVDSLGNVYVADAGNSRIQKFTNNGKFINKWGSLGFGNGQFISQQGIAVDSSGNVYVSESGSDNKRIQKFDSNGNFITKWGSRGSGDGQFNYPQGVAVDSSGNVYVDDYSNNRVQKFAPTEPIVARFTSNITSGYAPLSVKFTDQSTGSPTSWSWDFGDNTSSTTRSPVHTYRKEGNYTVNLTVTNAAGSNTTTKPNYIVVSPRIPPVAIFSASPLSGKKPLTVKFTDKSTGSPTSWSWNFGDKTTTTAQSPTHKYTKAGKYTVSLTVKNAAGSNTTKKTNYITVK